MRKAIVYYTDNVLSRSFARKIRERLKLSAGDIPIVWVSQKPIAEKDNIVLEGIERSHRSRCLQILTGLRRVETDIVYFAEHDVIYHPSHFEFEPPEKDVFYYNVNRWWLRAKDGQACFHEAHSLSQLVAYKKITEDFYIRRMAYYVNGIKIGIGNEPGKRNVPKMPRYKIGDFKSEWPNVDIRHKRNYTQSNKFIKDGYILQDGIPFWGQTKGRYKEFIKGL